MALGLLGKELPEVSFLKQLVDLDLQCDAVLRFVTVVLLKSHQRPEFRKESVLGSKTVTTKLTSKSPKKKNVENFFDKYFFEIDSSLRKTFAEETRIIRQELEKDHYAATKHALRLVAT